MYKFSGIVSLCSQGKFLNMITRLEDILKWIHVHVYINFSFIDHLLQCSTHNKEYKYVFVVFLRYYTCLDTYEYEIVKKKIDIHKDSAILKTCNDKKCIAVYDGIERNMEY